MDKTRVAGNVAKNNGRLDDLMDLAIDSPIISKLFTQGRHRNASVILLLQNAFPKGKHNTNISRNAQYMVFFRCPADRRQFGIMAERIFDKQKPLFLEIYSEITVKPYSYGLIDNKADTAVHRQIIRDWHLCVIRITQHIKTADIRKADRCTKNSNTAD